MSVTSVPWQGTPDAFGRNHRRARSVASRVSRQGSTRTSSVTYGIAGTARIPPSPPRRPAAGRTTRSRSPARQAQPLRPPTHRRPTVPHGHVPPEPAHSRRPSLLSNPAVSVTVIDGAPRYGRARFLVADPSYAARRAVYSDGLTPGISSGLLSNAVRLRVARTDEDLSVRLEVKPPHKSGLN
jgi:hypothetical protein